MDFHGKVVVITGAGRGLGRSYAVAIGKCGASVVVNDYDLTAAQDVVREINSTGTGRAVADGHSVEQGKKIIDTAIERFGRIDAVVNNAGVLRDRSFLKMTDEDWDQVYKVHLLGTFRVSKAAWPYFIAQKYGRIVNISSPHGLHGNFGQANYGAMKMGILGLSKAIAVEGAKHGIKVNVVVPTAASRMTQTVMEDRALNLLKPEYVGGVVTLLCHESCPCNGSTIEVGGRWVAALRWQETEGVIFHGNDIFDAQKIAAKWDDINDFSNTERYPTSGMESFAKMMDAATIGSTSAEERPNSEIKSDAYFRDAMARINGPAFLRPQELAGVSAKVFLNINDGQRMWMLDVPANDGKINLEPCSNSKVRNDIALEASDEAVTDWMCSRVDLHSAVMTRRISVRGNMRLALRLAHVLERILRRPGEEIKNTRTAVRSDDDKRRALVAVDKLTSMKVPGAGTSSAETPAKDVGVTSTEEEVGAFFARLAAAPESLKLEVVKKINLTIRFLLGESGNWYADLKNPPGTVTTDDGVKKADVTLEIAPDAFLDLVHHRANAEMLYMRGKLKIKGSMTTAMKVKSLLDILKRSKL